MAVIPPVALSASLGGVVYLLEFQEPKPGETVALIAWTHWDGKAWADQRATVPEDDLTRIEGQNYLGVMRLDYRDTHRMRRERGERGV